ncbi:MAG: hypothetical protein QW688_01820 [Thermoprotei archaeon]
MRLKAQRMVLAIVSALLSYLFLLYLFPRALSSLGLGSTPSTILPQESVYSALGIVVLEALSALFSTTRIRGLFMVGVGLLGYIFTASTFSRDVVTTHTSQYSVSVDVGFIVLVIEILSLTEAARGCVTLMADNT